MFEAQKIKKPTLKKCLTFLGNGTFYPQTLEIYSISGGSSKVPS